MKCVRYSGGGQSDRIRRGEGDHHIYHCNEGKRKGGDGGRVSPDAAAQVWWSGHRDRRIQIDIELAGV